MSGWALRAARPTDAGAVGAILSAFTDDTAWMPRLHSRAEDIGFAGQMIDRGWVRVASDADGVVGFLARDGADLHALYVRPGMRGRGVGAALLNEAQAQTGRLKLATFAANAAARRFYLRHGFVETGRGDGRDNDEGLPDVIYHWRRAPGPTPQKDAGGDMS